jgi:hypothetical protein
MAENGHNDNSPAGRASETAGWDVEVIAWSEWEELDPDRDSGSYFFYGYRETSGIVSRGGSAERVGFRLVELARDSDGDFEFDEFTFTDALSTASMPTDESLSPRAVARTASALRSAQNMVPPAHSKFRHIHRRFGSALPLTNLEGLASQLRIATETLWSTGLRAIEGPDDDGSFRLVPTDALLEALASNRTHFYLSMGDLASAEIILLQIIACNVASESAAENSCCDRNLTSTAGVRYYCSPRNVHMTCALAAERTDLASTFELVWRSVLAEVAPRFAETNAVAEASDASLVTPYTPPLGASQSSKRAKHVDAIRRLLRSDDEATSRQAFELVASLGDEAPWEQFEAGFSLQRERTTYAIRRLREVKSKAGDRARTVYRLEKFVPIKQDGWAEAAANLDNLWSVEPVCSSVVERDESPASRHAIDIVTSADTFAARMTSAWMILRRFEPQPPLRDSDNE